MKAIKSILRQAGFVVARVENRFAAHLEIAPENLFDEILIHRFRDLEGLRFIQVGANDGKQADPIRRHILERHWKGILIEPIPSVFERLKANYAGLPNLQFLNAAVDVTPGERTIYHLDALGIELPEWTRGLGSFDRDHIVRTLESFKLSESHLAESHVPAITWEQVLAKSPNGGCDVLVVDVEGFDIPLLKAASLASWRPAVMLFEHATATIEDRFAFYSTLAQIGYEVATDHGDTIAWLQPGPIL